MSVFITENTNNIPDIGNSPSTTPHHCTRGDEATTRTTGEQSNKA